MYNYEDYESSMWDEECENLISHLKETAFKELKEENEYLKKELAELSEYKKQQSLSPIIANPREDTKRD